LDEEIEDDISIRKMDRGKLSKWKNPLLALPRKKGTTGW
jgi:hypothetical protein